MSLEEEHAALLDEHIILKQMYGRACKEIQDQQDADEIKSRVMVKSVLPVIDAIIEDSKVILEKLQDALDELRETLNEAEEVLER